MYELIITDNHNLSESEIQKIAQESAANEARLRGWGDYHLVERQLPEQVTSSQRRYYFEVEGCYLPMDEDDSDDSESLGNAKPPVAVAKA